MPPKSIKREPKKIEINSRGKRVRHSDRDSERARAAAMKVNAGEQQEYKIRSHVELVLQDASASDARSRCASYSIKTH